MRRYSDYVYRLLGITQPSWGPENRWRTSGIEAFTNAPDIYTGALDRMWSGYQKRSAWEGIGAYMTDRSTGTTTTGIVDPNPDLVIPYQTQRALKDSNQNDWALPGGFMVTNDYYAATYAAAQPTSQGIVSTIMRALARRQ